MYKSRYAKKRDFSSLAKMIRHDEDHAEEELEKMQLSSEDEEYFRLHAIYPPIYSGPGAPNVINFIEDNQTGGSG